MQFKKFGDKVIIRLDRGEEIVKTLKEICESSRITLGGINGIGAVSKAKIGIFDVKNKSYHYKEITGNYEIAPLLGNITLLNGEISLHLHATLSNEKGILGGHLQSAIVSATFEVIIDIINGKVIRKYDEETGFNLMKI
jgi:hypothetical protein